jgi:hypothetical protein
MWFTRFSLSDHTNLPSFLIGHRCLFYTPVLDQVSLVSEAANIFDLKA